MKIHVRRRHIERGKMCHKRECPVALAITEKVGSLSYVAGRWIDIGLLAYRTPSSVQRFIARFDAGKSVKPFAFVLK